MVFDPGYKITPQKTKQNKKISSRQHSGTDELSQAEDVAHPRSCEDHTAETVTFRATYLQPHGTRKPFLMVTKFLLRSCVSETEDEAYMKFFVRTSNNTYPAGSSNPTSQHSTGATPNCVTVFERAHFKGPHSGIKLRFKVKGKWTITWSYLEKST